MAAPSSWKAWRSVSVAWARMGTEVPAKLEELWRASAPPSTRRRGRFSTMRYTTVRSLRREPGAACPAFTLSAPGGDAETVRRHGDFVSASRRTPVRQSGVRTDRWTAQAVGVSGRAVSCSGQVDLALCSAGRCRRGADRLGVVRA